MRLLINATTLMKNPRGVGVYTKNILNHWHSEKMQTDVLIPQESFPLITNSTLNLIQTPSIQKHILRLAWLQKFNFRKSLKLYDAVLTTVPEAPFSLKVPFFITVHDLIALKFQSFVSKKYYAYFKWVLPKILQKATGIISISENTKQDLLDFYPELKKENIQVVYNGVDHSFFHVKELKLSKAYSFLDKPYFISVGHFDHHKNIPFLIRAFAKICHKIPHNLVIIGRDENNLFQNILAEINSNQLSERIIRLENVSNEILAELYSNTAGLLFPSLYEGFGLPVLEAMACGAPVICNDISSLPEVIGDAGILCPVNDETSWSEKILTLCEEEKRNEYKLKSLNRAKEFQWLKTSKEIEDFILSKLT